MQSASEHSISCILAIFFGGAVAIDDGLKFNESVLPHNHRKNTNMRRADDAQQVNRPVFRGLASAESPQICALAADADFNYIL